MWVLGNETVYNFNNSHYTINTRCNWQLPYDFLAPTYALVGSQVTMWKSRSPTGFPPIFLPLPIVRSKRTDSRRFNATFASNCVVPLYVFRFPRLVGDRSEIWPFVTGSTGKRHPGAGIILETVCSQPERRRGGRDEVVRLEERRDVVELEDQGSHGR